MTQTMLIALLVACGEQIPKSKLQSEAPAKEISKAGVKAKVASTEEDRTQSPQTNVSSLRTGKQVYTQVCVTCHQANGEGMRGVYPPLAGSEWVAKSNETLIKIVLHGLMGEIEVKGTKYNNVMSPWGAVLDDEEMANVLTYIRSSWGNTGGAVTAEEVKVVRDANKGHSPWLAADL